MQIFPKETRNEQFCKWYCAFNYKVKLNWPKKMLFLQSWFCICKKHTFVDFKKIKPTMKLAIFILTSFFLGTIFGTMVTYQKTFSNIILENRIFKMVTAESVIGCASICTISTCNYFYHDSQTSQCFLGNLAKTNIALVNNAWHPPLNAFLKNGKYQNRRKNYKNILPIPNE